MKFLITLVVSFGLFLAIGAGIAYGTEEFSIEEVFSMDGLLIVGAAALFVALARLAFAGGSKTPGIDEVYVFVESAVAAAGDGGVIMPPRTLYPHADSECARAGFLQEGQLLQWIEEGGHVQAHAIPPTTTDHVDRMCTELSGGRKWCAAGAETSFTRYSVVVFKR